MTQDKRNSEQTVREMPWETVALEPDPVEVEKIDRQVPLAWTQTLEQEDKTPIEYGIDRSPERSF